MKYQPTQTLGPGDNYSRASITGRVNPSASLGAGSGQSATVVPAGTVLVEDISNARSATGTGLLVPGNENSHFGNWKYPSSAAILRAGRAFVLAEQATVGAGNAKAFTTGLVTALAGAAIDAGAAVSVSVANNTTRGRLIPATAGLAVVGIAKQEASANGDEILVDFWGFGAAVGNFPA